MEPAQPTVQGHSLRRQAPRTAEIFDDRVERGHDTGGIIAKLDPARHVRQHLLAIRTANKLYQSGFKVISSQALNSVCSRRLCARLASNRLIMVASLPLVARRTGASGSIVLLSDSAIGPGHLAVIATPSRAWRPRTPPAAWPASRGCVQHCSLFPRVLTGGCVVRLDLRPGENVISCRLLRSPRAQRNTIARGSMFRAGWG
jgi:hypothetical protein